MIVYGVAVLCVLIIAAGQILFKMSAAALSETGSFFSIKAIATLLPALLLYALSTLAWVWILQKVELGRIYPIMALSFVLVPLGSYFVFGERLSLQYIIGVATIITGIIIVVKS